MTAMEVRAVALWRTGLDTMAIAEALGVREPWVCRAIAAERDHRLFGRRQARRAGA